MWYVYCLSSQKNDYLYVGLTNNVVRRAGQHNAGRARTTRPYRPFDLLLVEEFDTRPEARTREKFLKSGIGKEFLSTLRMAKKR